MNLLEILEERRRLEGAQKDAVKAFYKGFGKAIVVARKEVSVTQDKLGLSIGLSRTSVTNMEAGKQRVLLHTILLIASALNKTPAQMMELTMKMVSEEEHDEG